VTAVETAYDDLDAAVQKVAALSYEGLSPAEVLQLLARRERLFSAWPSVDHVLIAQLTAEVTPDALGAASWRDGLATTSRISTNAAKHRLAAAQVLGPRQALTGETLPPLLEQTAAAQARGELGAEHVKVIEQFFEKLPNHVNYQARELAEADLARAGTGLRPEPLRQVADRLMLLLDEDGPMPSDVERARRRFLTISRQGTDGMSKVTGMLDPEARATLDAVLAKLAAPGMCNPADEQPCVDGAPTEQHRAADDRSPGQRNHDALTAMGRALLASGKLGQHNGLPTSIIVTTTLKELEAAVGFAVTGGGTLLPMADVIRMASQCHPFLVVYEGHSEIPMYAGRGKRLATPGQRIVLHARDRGCTRPGCTAPGYWAQVHHAAQDWIEGGETNLDGLTLACGPDNRLVEKGGWSTQIRADGRVEWLAPSAMDTGQSRVNNYHHPAKYLLPEEDQGP
jgi:hypothetical protein